MINNNIHFLGVTVSSEESIDSVVRKISTESKNVAHPGVAVVLDSQGIVLGIVTDGDIRRAYANNTSFDQEISQIMILDPITILDQVKAEDIKLEINRKVRLSERLHAKWVRYILVVNIKNQLVDIIDYLEILQNNSASVKRVAVFGMGYVGITLSVSLANQGHQVTGIDIESAIVERLNDGTSHILEPGLPDMLSANLKRGSISFNTALESSLDSIYVIAVGTPLDLESKPDMSALRNVLNVISEVLEHGNQIMLRSTVPVGVTRDFVIPYLEEKTGLKAGVNFYVSFAPERTVEGNAMNELKTLPQVVGGYTPECVRNSVEFWSTLTPFVVRVDKLEAAELVKLANNTYRDLTFSFANELALLSDQFNVNTFDLISAANEGYPRDKIPFPSPGVGGYCLTKDPILFSATSKGLRDDAVLGISSRKINERAILYPIKLMERYAKKIQKPLSKLNVLIVGVAFKGIPETKDIRGSVSIDLFNKVSKLVNSVFAWDAIISSDELATMGFEVMESLKIAVHNADMVLIMNNHPDNVDSSMYAAPKHGKLLFDGWNQLNLLEVEKVPGLIYSTMGYMTE
jgi:UDP-N-acetyl-D-mannosaminuronic acid dehydrogenase